uniref:Gamma-soluble NSF attachment protein n=1 Tax=Acrobeloides nanus TaxID=290746 RepID=A0A914CVE2_9BILA
MSANERRIAEANECFQRAQKHLKTSIWQLKTKPDYDSAAVEYERAAVCFRNAERLDLCKDAYLKASECHGSNGNRFHEAKAKESAAMVAKDAKDFASAVKLFEECSEGYLHSGHMDTAAMTIDKGAKMMELSEPKEAIKLYEKGLELVQQADRSRMAMDFSHRLIRLHLGIKDYPAAIRTTLDLIEKYKEVQELPKIGQLVVGLVLIELVKGDSISALKMLNYLPNADDFREEISVTKALLDSFDEGDDKAFQEVLKRGYLRSMDNEYLRLMKLLHAPSGGGGSKLGATDSNLENEEEDLR